MIPGTFSSPGLIGRSAAHPPLEIPFCSVLSLFNFFDSVFWPLSPRLRFPEGRFPRWPRGNHHGDNEAPICRHLKGNRERSGVSGDFNCVAARKCQQRHSLFWDGTCPFLEMVNIWGRRRFLGDGMLVKTFPVQRIDG